MKNSNSIWLNGRPLDRDLSDALGCEVRVANDANCLAVSEATDGAAAGKRVVFGVILGTGCGGGVAVGARVHEGPNGVAGEWGHNPLPWPKPEEYPDRPATAENADVWRCGSLAQASHWITKQLTGKTRSTQDIVLEFEAGDREAAAAIERFEDRLARGLAQVINILDPDMIVIGGGVSRLDHIYQEIPKKLPAYVFGGEVSTPVVPAKYGDSSGVRGAAWLWPSTREARMSHD